MPKDGKVREKVGGSGFCIVPQWKDKVGTRKDVYPLILNFSSYTGWAAC